LSTTSVEISKEGMMLSSNIKSEKLYLAPSGRILTVSLVLMVLLVWLTPESNAEQLDAEVELFVDLLPFQKQEKLEDLAEELEQYFRDFEWIEDYGGPMIPLRFMMYLVDESTGFEDRYGARIHVSNDYDWQFLDKDCHFAYQPEEPLEHDAIIYHPLAGLLDFYAYLIIGDAMDKGATLGGDPYYRMAQEIVKEGQFSEYYRGWNRRSELLEAILAEENLTYRKMLAVYFRALSYWGEERVDEARSTCRIALAMIDDMWQEEQQDEDLSTQQEEQIARFFTHHHLEIADLFAEDPLNQDVLDLLMTIDPEHGELYQKYLEN
jgi:hypothetical protein